MKRFNLPLDKMVCVGDRLYTDIALGVNAGTETVCVFTGEATLDDLKDTHFKPTFYFDSIRGLYEAIKD